VQNINWTSDCLLFYVCIAFLFQIFATVLFAVVLLTIHNILLDLGMLFMFVCLSEKCRLYHLALNLQICLYCWHTIIISCWSISKTESIASKYWYWLLAILLTSIVNNPGGYCLLQIPIQEIACQGHSWSHTKGFEYSETLYGLMSLNRVIASENCYRDTSIVYRTLQSLSLSNSRRQCQQWSYNVSYPGSASNFTAKRDSLHRYTLHDAKYD